MKQPTDNKKIKVAFFLDGGEGGGVVEYIRLLLSYIDRKEFHTTGFYLGRGNSYEALSHLFDQTVVLTQKRLVNYGNVNSSIKKLQVNVGKSITAIKGVLLLAKALRRYQIDVVDVNYYPHHLLAGIACRLTNVPCIWHWHGAAIHKKVRGFLTKNGIQYLCDKMIPISHFVKRSLPKGALSKVRVIYNGIESLKISSEQQKGYLRNLIGASTDTKLVGILGTLTPLKGHQYFIEAADIVLKKYPDVKFLIIGTETEAHKKRFHFEESLRKKVQALHREDAILFLGRIPQASRYISDCTIVCMPTIPYAQVMGEGFGLAMAEAMAAGVPVIATSTGAFPEIITDGVNGILLPLKDSAALSSAILELLENEPFRNGVAAEGQKRIRNEFDIQKTVKEVQSVYREVVLK